MKNCEYFSRMVTPSRPVAGEGGQFDSLSMPGDSCWMYISSEPSVLNFGSSRWFLNELPRSLLRGVVHLARRGGLQDLGSKPAPYLDADFKSKAKTYDSLFNQLRPEPHTLF